ncbi:hypothetical protein [Microviridae sp.]|nr:hypothetical protein [Microviridae sp.]
MQALFLFITYNVIFIFSRRNRGSCAHGPQEADPGCAEDDIGAYPYDPCTDARLLAPVDFLYHARAFGSRTREFFY